MTDARKVKEVLTGQATVEGAGVRLRRVFGFAEVGRLDPFLLLDDFGSNDPTDYLAGFPWHPHRGIETVTYMLAGEVEHGDSLGNTGVIGTGDVQWMTAGNGIIHQEMPRRWAGRMRGLQLWVNLPAASKMMEPRYRDVEASTIPTVEPGAGVTIRVIAGSVAGIAGPVDDVVVAPEYLDVALGVGVSWWREVPRGHTVLAYVLEGSVRFDVGHEVSEGQLVLFDQGGDGVEISAGEVGVRLVLVSGRRLDEPIAWYGPIVMNTREELETAFSDYHQGTFIRRRGSRPS